MNNNEWYERTPTDQSHYKTVYWLSIYDNRTVNQGSTLYLIHTLEDTFVIQRGVAAPVSESLRIGPVFTDLQAAKMFYLLTN